MTTPTQQDAPTMFYPLNPCGHLRGPGGGCIGSPECKREPVSADKLGELVQRAGELRARLVAHPSQAVTGEGRATVADKLGAAVSLGECLSAVLANLLEHKAILTTEVSPPDRRGPISTGITGDQGTTPSRDRPYGSRDRLFSFPALGIIRYKLLDDLRGLMRGPDRSHRGFGGCRPPPWAGGSA
jgi:hypothetical protein